MVGAIALVTVLPVAVMASVWSDVQAIQETIEQRKQDASQASLPGDYHTLYDEVREYRT
jgi:hypothetical protein